MYKWNEIKSNQINIHMVFEERGKPEYPDKNLTEEIREPTNSTHLWHRIWESNPGHIGGRRVLSPLGYPCSLSPCVIRGFSLLFKNTNNLIGAFCFFFVLFFFFSFLSQSMVLFKKKSLLKITTMHILLKFGVVWSFCVSFPAVTIAAGHL